MTDIYVLGSVNMDLVIQSRKLPRPGETLLGSSFLMNPGGKGANQAVAVSLSGGHAKFIGAVGSAFGHDLLNALRSYEVDISHIKIYDDIASGVAVILLSGEDNRIIVDPGANGHIDASLIEEALSQAKPGDYLLAQLEIPVAAVVEAFKLAKAKGMITCLNTAPALSLPDDLFPQIDYLCLNQTETLLYTGVEPVDHNTAKLAGSHLQSKGVQHVIITMGEHGAYYIGKTNEHYVKSQPVTPVDTTAAGDTYIGSLLACLAKGQTLADAMAFAACAAAICVTRNGAQQSIPTQAETLEFMRKRHG
jgi:ribokinase